MKRVGTTNEGNILLEASSLEYMMLGNLANAVEGKPLEEIYTTRNPQLMPDYSGIFGTIEAFFMAQYRINELQLLIEQFKGVLSRTEE